MVASIHTTVWIGIASRSSQHRAKWLRNLAIFYTVSSLIIAVVYWGVFTFVPSLSSVISGFKKGIEFWAYSFAFTTVFLVSGPVFILTTQAKKRTVEDGNERTVEDDTERTVEDDTERTVEDDTERTVEDDTERTVEDDTERTVEDDTERTVEDDTERTVEDDTERTVEDDTERTVEDDTERTGLLGQVNPHYSSIQSDPTNAEETEN